MAKNIVENNASFAPSASKWHRCIATALSISDGVLTVDLGGSSSQHSGPFNAVRAVTTAAVFYTLRCLLPREARLLSLRTAS